MSRVAMVVTNACSPDPRVLRHAAWMLALGFEVTIHAFDRDEEHPMSENVGGVRIMRYRVGKVPYGGTVSTYRGIRRFQQTVVRTLLNDPPALVYCHDADTLAVGTTMRQQKSIPFVFDMHDLQHTWVRYAAPQSMIRSWVSKRMKFKMLDRAKHAQCIITSSGAHSESSSRGFGDWLEHHGMNAHVVENRPLPPFSTSKKTPQSDWTVGFVGKVRDMKAMELLIEAVKQLPPHERPSLRIAGDGTVAAALRRRLMDEMDQETLVAEVSGAFTQHELDEILDGLDVMFAMYAPQRGNILQGALPVKMFDAAARGIPSVVNDGCLMGDVARDEAIGEPAPWGDSKAVAQALLACKNKVVELNHDGEREHQRWLKAIQPVVKGLQ